MHDMHQFYGSLIVIYSCEFEAQLIGANSSSPRLITVVPLVQGGGGDVPLVPLECRRGLYKVDKLEAEVSQCIECFPFPTPSPHTDSMLVLA